MARPTEVDDCWYGVRYFRLNELARYTGMPRSSLHAMVRDGMGPPAKVLNPNSTRRIFLFERAAVDKWIASLPDHGA